MGIGSAVAAAEQQGGVARRGGLLGWNVSPRDLGDAVEQGALLRLRRGVYGVPHAAPAVLLAAAHGGAVACTSALVLLSIWVLSDGGLHVELGAKGRAHPHDRCRCVDHHRAGATRLGCVPLVDALIQSARCAGAETFFAAFESAWRQGRLSAADRVVIRSALPARLAYLLDVARPDADSGLESLLRLRLARLGLRLECQVPISGVGRVDFVVAGRLILEVDGRLNHDGPSERHRDLARDAVAATLGYSTLRFDYALVVHRWDLVEAAILARLAA